MFVNSSMNNIYESNYSKLVKQNELNKAKDKYNKAQNPMKTGIVSRPAFASQFSQVLETNDNLSGLAKSDEDYFHNNMQPYLRGNITQNTDIERMSNYTNRRTGNDDLYIHKREVPNMFKPTIDDQVCGMKNNDDFYKSRLNNSSKRNNEFPIEPIRVGPGLNKGYSSVGVGGYQQADTLKFVTPVDIQKNKPLTDQTSKTFRIPFQGPTNKIGKRGALDNLSKNLPDKVFENNIDNLFRTTGAVLKPTVRTNENLKATNAPISHVEYKGNLKDNELRQSEKDNYNKENVIVYDNERQSYETKTVVSNVKSMVEAIVSPVLDTMKHSIKEYFVDAARQEGMMNPQIPNAITVHDSSDITRTTIKETTIHNSDKLNLKGEDGTYTMLHDDARTTTKETTIHDNDNTNLKGGDGTYTMLHDDARTTTKETTIHDNENTNLKGGDGTYYGIDDVLKTTTKETIAIKDVYRNIGGTTYRTIYYDPDLVAKTTTKQTTIHKSEGFISGILEGLFGGYLSANPEAKNTNSQFNHIDYKGTLTTNIKNQVSHEATNNAEIDGTREAINIASGHTPNGGQSNLGKIHNSHVNVKSNKTISESISQRSEGNLGRIYQQTPNTNACGITKETDQLNSYENRLDPNTLSQLKTNPYNLSIIPN
jgi:hypothetical protein